MVVHTHIPLWFLINNLMSLTCDRSVVFSGTLVSSINKTDCHDITRILLKVALNTINQPITWIPPLANHLKFKHQVHGPYKAGQVWFWTFNTFSILELFIPLFSLAGYGGICPNTFFHSFYLFFSQKLYICYEEKLNLLSKIIVFDNIYFPLVNNNF
jgi:hypothetical protein